MSIIKEGTYTQRQLFEMLSISQYAWTEEEKIG